MNLSRLKVYNDTILTPEDEKAIEEARNEPGGISLEELIAKSRLQDIFAKQRKSYAKV
ncbi:MAG: hypothetical protein PHH70_05225 [Candidatus Gracilibacteria bacterium]|nr:hypothetical protein [Candidatus Gracilibacteria bacterium]